MSLPAGHLSTTEAAADGQQRGRMAWRVIAFTLGLLAVIQIAKHYAAVVVRDDLYMPGAVQHTWRLHQLNDPELFHDDLLARYASMPARSPPAYEIFFQFGLGPQRTAEGLGVALALASLLLTWRIGVRLAGQPGGAAAVGLFTFFAFDRLCEGGVPASFGFPLLLAGMLAVLSRSWTWVGVVFVLCAMFFPPMLLMLAPVAGVVLVFSVFCHVPPNTSPVEPFRRPWASYAWLGGLTICAAAIVASVCFRPVPPEIGPTVTFDEAKQMPEWSAAGRMAFFRAPNVYWYHCEGAGIGLKREYLVIALVALGLSIAILPRSLRPEAGLLLLVAVTLWGFAHLLLFRLGLPGQYTEHVFPVFAIMWAAGAVGIVANIWCARWKVCGLNVFTALACLVAVAVVGVLASTRIQRSLTGPATGNPPAGFEEAIQIIATLPKDALIAAHPDDADVIPLRARRSVLASTAMSEAIHRDYAARMRDRLSASFAMLYAIDWPRIDAIADEHGVQYFLVRRSRLMGPDPYFEPFETANRQHRELGRAKGYAMLGAADHRIVFASGDVLLLRVGASGDL